MCCDAVQATGAQSVTAVFTLGSTHRAGIPSAAAAAGSAPAETADPQERLRQAQTQAEAAERVLAASVM